MVAFIKKAGQLWSTPDRTMKGLTEGLTELTYPSLYIGGFNNPRFRVGVFKTRKNQPPDPVYEKGFSDKGFKTEFQDCGGNQVRHFIGSLAGGYVYGEFAADIAFATLFIFPSAAAGTIENNKPDLLLSLVAFEIGADFSGDTTELANTVNRRVCGGGNAP